MSLPYKWSLGQPGRSLLMSLVQNYWKRYANIKFEFDKGCSEAELRIKFDAPGSESFVETWCLTKRSKIGTMALAITLENARTLYNSSVARLRRFDLHEFGHVRIFSSVAPQLTTVSRMRTVLTEFSTRI
jgi:hypothetical protein